MSLARGYVIEHRKVLITVQFNPVVQSSTGKGCEERISKGQKQKTN